MSTPATGITIVENRGELALAEAGRSLSPEPILFVGTVEGGEVYQLFGISGPSATARSDSDDARGWDRYIQEEVECVDDPGESARIRSRLEALPLPGFYPSEIGENYILGTARDEMEVEYVGLHDLQRPES